MQAILKLPNVIAPDESKVDEKEWEMVEATIDDAISAFQGFRLEEGSAMEKDCTLRIGKYYWVFGRDCTF